MPPHPRQDALPLHCFRPRPERGPGGVEGEGQGGVEGEGPSGLGLQECISASYRPESHTAAGSGKRVRPGRGEPAPPRLLRNWPSSVPTFPEARLCCYRPQAHPSPLAPPAPLSPGRENCSRRQGRRRPKSEVPFYPLPPSTFPAHPWFAVQFKTKGNAAEPLQQKASTGRTTV